MKLLDKYIAKNFIIGYAISFCVLIGLRIIIDLFVNLDEFTEHSGLDTLSIIKNILIFYGLNATLYFRDFSGMIMVVAAAFSLGRMVRNNELVAIMASGVSLKRVIGPIVVLCLLLTGLLVIDQELIIPSLSDKLVRNHDDVPGEESFDMRFMGDGNGSLICTQRYDVKTATLQHPTIILRSPTGQIGLWQVTGRIDADRAEYNFEKKRWDLVNGTLIEKAVINGIQKTDYYISDLKPKDIPVRRKAEYKAMLSSRQLSILAKQGKKIKDVAQLYSQKHFRITEPIFNLIMLLIALPVLVCRDPKAMKSAIMISFLLTAAALTVSFACKLMATEFIFDRLVPEFWAWLPIFIFFTLAFIQIDSMKT